MVSRRGAELITAAGGEEREKKWSKSNSTNQFLLWFVSWLLSFPLNKKREEENKPLRSNNQHFFSCGGKKCLILLWLAAPSKMAWFAACCSLFAPFNLISLIIKEIQLNCRKSNGAPFPFPAELIDWMNAAFFSLRLLSFRGALAGARPTNHSKSSKEKAALIHQSIPFLCWIPFHFIPKKGIQGQLVGFGWFVFSLRSIAALPPLTHNQRQPNQPTNFH